MLRSWIQKECNRFKCLQHSEVEFLWVFWCHTVCDISRDIPGIFIHVSTRVASWVFFPFSVWWLQHVYMRAHVCMCWCVFVWTLDHQLISHTDRHQRRFELTLRVGAAQHAIRNFTSLPLQQHQTYMAHSYWNEQMKFCHEPSCHPSLREDKTSKEQRYIRICLQVVSLRVVAGEVKVFCLSEKVWAKCRYHVFLIKAGQLCFHYSPFAAAGSLSPWLDTAEMMSCTHTHLQTHTGAHIKAYVPHLF